MCSSWKPARGGAPGVWPRGGGRGRALWGRHNALNTRLPPLCPAAPPACPAAPLYRAATAPSRRNARRPVGPGQPRRFKAARRVPTPAGWPRPRRPTPARPGPARPGSGLRVRQPGRKSTSGPRDTQPTPERRAGRDSPRCSGLRTPLPGQGPSILPERPGGGGCRGRRRSGSTEPGGGVVRGPTQASAISPPPHAASAQRPICLFPCRRARLQNFGVQATSSPSGAAMGVRIVRNPILQTLNLRPCEPSTGTQLGMNPGVLWTSAPLSQLLESCSQGPTRDRTSPAVGPKRSCGGCFLHGALWVSNHRPNNGKCLGVPDLQEHRMGLSPHDQCLSYSHLTLAGTKRRRVRINSQAVTEVSESFLSSLEIRD